MKRILALCLSFSACTNTVTQDFVQYADKLCEVNGGSLKYHQLDGESAAENVKNENPGYRIGYVVCMNGARFDITTSSKDKK